MGDAFIIWRRQDGRNIGKHKVNSFPYHNVKVQQQQQQTTTKTTTKTAIATLLKNKNINSAPLCYEHASFKLHLYGFVAYLTIEEIQADAPTMNICEEKKAPNESM